MIRIVKPIKGPKILVTKGTAQIQQDCAAYDAIPTDYRSGAKPFVIDSKIYGAESVKKALRRAQYDKCCYCESKFLQSAYGTVEHYRPKGAVKQSSTHNAEYPGYYWLAYDWNNLLMSCPVCNTTKGILFPLQDHAARARSHHDDITTEHPLFIHPVFEDPRQHIRFEGPTPVPITEAGRETIERLNLRRDRLEWDRQQRLAELKLLRKAIERWRNSPDPQEQILVQEMREHLAAAVRPEAEYSAMAQDFLADNP